MLLPPLESNFKSKIPIFIFIKTSQIWDISEKRIRNSLEGHRHSIYSVKFSSDGRFIVSGSNDETVRIWNVHDGTSRILTINDHYSANNDRAIVSVAISRDGRYVAGGSFDTVV